MHTSGLENMTSHQIEGMIGLFERSLEHHKNPLLIASCARKLANFKSELKRRTACFWVELGPEQGPITPKAYQPSAVRVRGAARFGALFGAWCGFKGPYYGFRRREIFLGGGRRLVLVQLDRPDAQIEVYEDIHGDGHETFVGYLPDVLQIVRGDTHAALTAAAVP